MEMVFHLAVFFLGGLCVAETEALTEGNVGSSIKITCSHVYAYSNAKYFCKHPCLDKDVLIHSGGKKTFSKGRYGIVDEGNTFFVTIAELEKTDAGKYWCGVERVGADTYNRVDLTVVDADHDNTNPYNVAADHMVYIGAGVGIAVLVLAIIFLIFIRHRHRETSLSPDKDRDIVDATSSNQQQDIHYGIFTFPSTAKENLGTENRTNPIYASSITELQDTSRGRTDNIYSNVIMSSESLKGPGCNVSVSFSRERDSLSSTRSRDTNSSALTPHTESVTYSAIKNKSRERDDVEPGC